MGHDHAVAHARLADFDRTDTGLDGAFRHLTVPHKTLAAVFRGETGMGGKQLGDLGFNGVSQKLPRAAAQDFGQRIGEFTRLAQGDDGIVFHGVSILSRICGWLSPPRYAASLSQDRHQASGIAQIS
jgi:hypothetical protein